MKYVIIGGSAAGVGASEAIRKKDKKSSIKLISDEKLPLYSRCLLTYYIADIIDETKLYFKPRDFYKKKNVDSYLGKKVLAIDRAKKKILLDDKKTIDYDKLLIATGASPKTVDVPGADKKGIFTVRNINDARTIMAMLDKAKHAVVLGGGLIGLRDAYALRKRGKKVTVIVKSSQVLSQMLDKDAADIIESLFRENGIDIMTGVAATKITGKESVEGIELDNGEKFACELIVIGKGVTPNTELASNCGLKVEDGIEVDEYLRTSDKDIFAAGDVAQTYDIAREDKRINALWPCAVEQGETAGTNMSGEKKIYEGSLSMNSVDFFGVASISMGITKPKKDIYESISGKEGNSYKKLVFKNNTIVGMVLVGEVRPSGVISTLIKNKIDISDIKDLLLENNFDYGKIMSLVKKYQDKFNKEEYKDTVITY